METTLGCFSSPPNLPTLAGSGSVFKGDMEFYVKVDGCDKN